MTTEVAWGDGQVIPSTPFRVVVPGAATGGHAVVLTVDMPPGLRVEAHTHEAEDQINVVVSGRIRCRVGEEEFVLQAGGVLLMPRLVEHELWNDTGEMARIVEIYTPPGMEATFAAAGAAAAATGRALAQGADYARAAQGPAGSPKETWPRE